MTQLELDNLKSIEMIIRNKAPFRAVYFTATTYSFELNQKIIQFSSKFNPNYAID